MINLDSLNIKTDNIPLLDELIFSLKKIVNTCVLKDQEQANKNETITSLRNSDLYISCILGRTTYDMFTYNQRELENVGIPYYLIDECLRDNKKIPEIFRKKLNEVKVKQTIDEYEELNNYYRMLNGLPNLGDKGLKIDASMIPQDIEGIDTSLYLHEMPNSHIDILYIFGVIDELIKDHPDKKYLKYMGSKSISIYNSRTAVDGQLLYMTSDVPTEVSVRFKEKIEINRVYTMKTVYSEAFKLGSDYYDNFIRSFILVQTMVDMITELPDMIIKREIFDIRMIKLIFENNGIDFFEEIPYRYQLAMVRNINRLIKFKSTTKNIIDICSLFGFENIKVFKYYLLKYRNIDRYGNYNFNYKEVIDEDTGEKKIVEDLDKDFELKLIKIPVDGLADDYIQDKSNYTEYDEVCYFDKYWNGDLEHEYVKSCIMEKEFNYVQSKYISIDTLYSLSELSFELIYFYNMIFDDVLFEDQLTLQVPQINGLGVFRFVDLICYLYALMYEYNGFEDRIFDSATKIMSIKGFNFKADMAKLAEYIYEKGYTLEELGVADFQIPDSYVLSYNQLMEIFTKNKNIHDHIIHELYNANNKEIYDIYKTIYDSLMITELNLEFFKLSNGKTASTYTEFLRERDPILYNSIIQIRNLDSLEVKREKISTIIDASIYAIESVIDLEQYKYLFNHMPAVGAEAVKYYIYKVINFFKSYKVDIMSINTVYVFDDKLENKIKMIDSAFIQYMYQKQDTIDLLIDYKNMVSINPEDRIKLLENIYIEYEFFLDKYFYEDYKTREKIFKNTDTCKKDSVFISDSINIKQYT